MSKRGPSTDIGSAAKHTKSESSSSQKQYLDEESADVHFIFDADSKNAQRIPAHKQQLAAKSEVFKAMLFGEVKEKGDISIVDVSVDVFKQFLKLFYGIDVALSTENINDMLNVCNKYDVADGSTACENFLKNSLTVENLCNVYSLAIGFDRKKLQRFCEMKIVTDTKAILNSSSFLTCDQNVLGHILDIKIFSCGEYDVFEACIAWVKAKSNLEELTPEAFKNHFGDLLYKIRFSMMSSGEFEQLTHQYGSLMTFDDYREVVQTRNSKKFKSKKFNMNRREVVWNEGTMIECKRELKAASSSYDNIGNETFSSNEPILLGGFLIEPEYFMQSAGKREMDSSSIGVSIIEKQALDAKDPRTGYAEAYCSGSDESDDSTEYSYKSRSHKKKDREVKKGSSNTSKIVSTTNSERVMMRYENEVNVRLPKPVLIRPGFFYSVSLRFADIIDGYECGELQKEIKLDDDVTITFHGRDGSSSGGDYIPGLITRLRFNRI